MRREENPHADRYKTVKKVGED